MAAHERAFTEPSIAPSLLLERLAEVLPTNKSFKIHHLSTPPTRTSAIYSAPPGARPDRTFCESHFLTASIQSSYSEDAIDVLVYAIEILIYSTAYDTTFFVSKADSTGYLHLLNLPTGTPSPLREISATFLQYLVEQHQRLHIRSVISLFARAQDQYLFPGSVEYSGKHVLDDRGLVRWWCRVLDPIIKHTNATSTLKERKWENIKGYLVVPGLDEYETSSCVPKAALAKEKVWTMGHPLREISRHGGDVPPRCLIPHYPDDPKARFLDELDDEISTGDDKLGGQWRSVKTIDQFWDMMAFRQECSAGRMVGFIWIVFTPKARLNAERNVENKDVDDQSITMSSGWVDNISLPMHDIGPSSTPTISPNTSFAPSSQIQPAGSPAKPNIPEGLEHPALTATLRVTPRRKKLTGPIICRQPKIKTHNKNYLLDLPESTAYYHWSPRGRGQIVVDESDYKRSTELLLRLDFANLKLAASSSRRWTNEVGSGVSHDMRDAWGQTVVGKKVVEHRSAASVTGANTLNMGLVRKKRKVSAEDLENNNPNVTPQTTAPAVNVLGAGIIRKKAKA